MYNALVTERVQIAAGVLPVNLATAAVDGDWVNMRLYGRLAVVVFKDGGAAAEAPTLSLQQATDNAGTGAKDLAFTTIRKKVAADVLTVGQFTDADQAAAASVALDDTEEGIYVIEILDTDLDMANGFTHVRARLSDPGVTAQIGAVLYLLADPRYASDPLPSAID